MKKYLVLVLTVITVTAINNHLNAQGNGERRRYHLHLIKKKQKDSFVIFRTSGAGGSDTIDFTQSLLTNTSYKNIVSQLTEQKATVDLEKGNMVRDGIDVRGAIIEYPIIPKSKAGAEFKSVIVFLDSLGDITAAYKDAVKGYAPPPSTEKIAICGFWSSWSTVSLHNCRLHPICPRNVYGARLAHQVRTRRCNRGSTETQTRAVFVGCNCYL